MAKIFRFLLVLVFFLASISFVILFAIHGEHKLLPHREIYLWGGIFINALLVGVFNQVIYKKLSVKNLVAVVLVGFTLIFLQGQFNLISKIKQFVMRPLGDGKQPELYTGNDYLSYIYDKGVGYHYFGNTWIHLLVLALLITILIAIFSATITYILRWSGFRFLGTYENWIGFRYLMAKRREGFISSTAVISISGVSLGVASLIAVTSVMSGYQRDVTSRLLDSNPHLVVQKYGIDFKEYEQVAESCLALDEVKAVSPFVFNEAMLSTDTGLMGIMIKGIDPKRAGSVTNIEKQLIHETSLDVMFSQADKQHHLPGILIGKELQKELELKIDDIVSLTTPVGYGSITGNAPNRMRFRIAGVFSSGVFEFDQKLIYADLQSSQQLMGYNEIVSGLEISTTAPMAIDTISQKINVLLKGYPYRTMDWREMNAGIFTALRIQKVLMFLVLTFIIIVAAFNIASTLFMVVVEKSEEIALLKAMGANNASVMKAFMVVGWIIGLVGTVIGSVVGIAVALLLEKADLHIAEQVYLVDSLSVQLNPMEIIVTAIAAVVISHLATIYPSLQAAQVQPASSLRYD